MASSTCDGSVAPDEHDEPAAAHTPAWSSSTSSASASTPANPTWAFPATLCRARPVLERVGDGREQAVDQPVAQRGDSGHFVRAGRDRLVDRRGHGDDTGDVDGARTQPALLTTAFDQRLEPAVPRTTSAPVPFGPPNLCADTATRSAAAARAATSTHETACTASVCSRARGGARPHQLGDLVEGLDGADLVVDEHDRHDNGAGVERSGERVEVDEPAAIDTDAMYSKAVALEPVGGGEHALVLERGRDDTVAGPGITRGAGRAFDREVVGLGSSTGEHDLRRVRAERVGDALARLFERGLGPARRRVRPRGVAEVPVRNGSIAAIAAGRMGVVAA